MKRFTVWRRLAALGVVVTCAGCAESEPAPLPSVAMDVDHVVVTSDVVPDPAVDALVQPFRTELIERTGEVIGTATGAFEKADPEGTLDNLVADAMLWSSRAEDDEPVAFSMANDGGLRAPINAGPITIAEVFELMPFENRVAILELSGHQVDSLAQQIARSNGEPVAGLTMVIGGTPTRARDVRIAGEPIDLDARYRMAVSDYLANGGGFWPQLWTPLAREDLDLLIRDGIEGFIRDQGTVTPTLDGRIRVEGGGGR